MEYFFIVVMILAAITFVITSIAGLLEIDDRLGRRK